MCVCVCSVIYRVSSEKIVEARLEANVFALGKQAEQANRFLQAQLDDLATNSHTTTDTDTHTAKGDSSTATAAAAPAPVASGALEKQLVQARKGPIPFLSFSLQFDSISFALLRERVCSFRFGSLL